MPLPKGFKHSKETKKKMSLSQMERISPNKGKKLSAEWRKKISESLKGKCWWTKEAYDHIGSTMQGMEDGWVDQFEDETDIAFVKNVI